MSLLTNSDHEPQPNEGRTVLGDLVNTPPHKVYAEIDEPRAIGAVRGA